MVSHYRMEAKENSDICELGCRGIWLARIDRVGWGKPVVFKKKFAWWLLFEKSALESSTSSLPHPLFLTHTFSLSLEFPFELPKISSSLQYRISFPETAVSFVNGKIVLREKKFISIFFLFFFLTGKCQSIASTGSGLYQCRFFSWRYMDLACVLQ